MIYNIKPKPTRYKNILMRSKTEAQMAYVLDRLNILWEYEKETLMLSNGETYLPDFYCPEINTYIEVKGVVNKEEIDKYYRITKLLGKELLLISLEDSNYFSRMLTNEGIQVTESEGQLIHCSNCKRYSFCDMVGIFTCRYCHHQDGDHDIILNDFGIQKIRNNMEDLN